MKQRWWSEALPFWFDECKEFGIEHHKQPQFRVYQVRLEAPSSVDYNNHLTTFLLKLSPSPAHEWSTERTLDLERDGLTPSSSYAGGACHRQSEWFTAGLVLTDSVQSAPGLHRHCEQLLILSFVHKAVHVWSFVKMRIMVSVDQQHEKRNPSQRHVSQLTTALWTIEDTRRSGSVLYLFALLFPWIVDETTVTCYLTNRDRYCYGYEINVQMHNTRRILCVCDRARE